MIKTQTHLFGTAIGLPIRPGVVPEGSIDWHIWQSHGVYGKKMVSLPPMPDGFVTGSEHHEILQKPPVEVELKL